MPTPPRFAVVHAGVSRHTGYLRPGMPVERWLNVRSFGYRSSPVCETLPCGLANCAVAVGRFSFFALPLPEIAVPAVV